MSKDRKKLYLRLFKAKWITFKGGYDIDKEPEVFLAIVEQYYNLTNFVATDHLEAFFASIVEKFPSPAEYQELIHSFRERRKPSLPPLTTKEGTLYGEIHLFLLPRLWPLLGNFEGEIEFAKVWKKCCDSRGIAYGEYWRDIIASIPPEQLTPDREKIRNILSKAAHLKAERKRFIDQTLSELSI